MALIFSADRVTFDGHCAIDEAEALLAWVRDAGTRGLHPLFDLSTCTHVHTALVQIVMRATGRVSTPETGLLSLCLRSVQARGPFGGK
jgi:hypothetical protein